jgi:basic amino acid/polyamine antiporter, APA family
MAATTAPSETVFLRRASGVVRAMSPTDGMFYGYLSATGIYSYFLILFLGFATFPRANFLAANIITFILFFFVFGTYALLGSTMPRSGGDYVFVSRIVHPLVGFVTSMAGWTLWQFFGCYFAASALINVVLRPGFDLIGVKTNQHVWITISNDLSKWWVRLPLVVLLIVMAGWICVNGMRWYTNVQKYFMMPGAILGLLIIAASLLIWNKNTFFSNFDKFQGVVGGQPSGSVEALAAKNGFNAHASTDWTDTVGMSVEFAYLYLWTMWSIELFGEMKSARRVRTVFGMFTGSHVLMFITYLVGFTWAYYYVGTAWMKSFAYMALNNSDQLGGGWDFRGAATFFYMPSLNLFLGIVLFLCFVGPASQSLFNTILGSSRLMLAASFDRLLPSWLGKVNSKGVPHVSIWLGVGLSAAVAATYEAWNNIGELLFWSTFMTLIAMAFSMLAGVLLPYRMKSVYEVSPASQYKLFGAPLIVVIGLISVVFITGLDLAAGLMNSQFHLFQFSNPAARAGAITAGVVTLASIIWYFVVVSQRKKEGIDVAAAFREIPPD